MEAGGLPATWFRKRVETFRSSNDRYGCVQDGLRPFGFPCAGGRRSCHAIRTVLQSAPLSPSIDVSLAKLASILLLIIGAQDGLMIYLTPASVVYFCQVILTTLVAGFLLWRSLQPVENRRQLRLAAGVFAVTALLLALLWVEVSALGPWRSYARFLNAPVLALHGIAIFLFIYHVPEWDPRERREVIVVVTFLVVARLLFEIYVAAQRIQALAATGETSRSRPLLSELLLLVVVIWLVVVSVRRARRLKQRSGTFLVEIALLSALMFFAVLVQTGYSLGWLSASVRQIALSLSAMIILPLFALIVFDMLTDPLTLLARLVGVVLVVALFLIGGVSWLLAPTYLDVAAGEYPPASAAVMRLPIDGRSLDQLVQTLVVPDTYQGLEPSGAPDEGAALASAASDSYPALRRVLHVPMLLLSLAAAFTTVWVIVAVPLLLRWRLFRPLDALLAGVHQVNAGRLDVEVPVHLNDELGQVTMAFNRMVAELRGMVATLEARVAERTADLTHSETRYRGLVEQIDDVIFRLALPELRIEYVSPHVERVFGISAPTVLGAAFAVSDIFHPDYVRWFQERLSELRQGQIDPLYEYKIIDRRGQERWIQQSNTAIYADGRLVAVEGVCRDVTAAKLAEAQLRTQQSELAALQERERISRDLHDGLGQVMGYVNVQAQAASALVEAGQIAQAEAMMAQLAQVAKDAHADIRRYILDLRLPVVGIEAQEWEEALRSYLQTFSQNYAMNVQLSYPAGLAPDPFSPAVGREVLRIVQEALNNVRKHAGVTTAQVIVLPAEDHVAVVVADSGVGFDVDGAGEPEPSGAVTGSFGLRMMRERAEAIGAGLQVRSAPGAGVQVTVRVPLGNGVPSRPVALPIEEAAVVGLRVLLADDHPLFLDGMRNMLTVRGVEVVGMALDGIEAQDLARGLQPDVILMDMNMPRCDGLEATALIKAELPQIKIIMLTVAAEQEKLFQALRAGASGYLLKSLDSSEFFQLLSEAMQGEIVLSQGLAEKALREFAQRSTAAASAVQPSTDGGPPTDLLLSLSARQRDILERAAKGSTYKEIAAALFISEATVKYHMGQIIELLQVENRREAIALARQAGLA